MLPSIHVQKPSDDLFIVGLDAEYEERDGANHILSYQWHVLHGARECSGILLVDGTRQKFAHLLQRILVEAKECGLFSRYPKEVVVAAHYSLAEMVAMADFHKLKTQLDGIRRTFCSVKKPLVVGLRDYNGNTRKVSVTLRDTLLLTPQGAGLQNLGEMHDLPKIELPSGAIERMDDLLRSDPALFERYAKRDAEIAARHALAMADLNYELNKKCDVPVSLGGLAISFAQSTWQASGINGLEVLGKEIHCSELFDSRTRRTLKTKQLVFRATLHEHRALAVESYHGGRNEAFFFGATAPSDWQDVDLCGAYTTALSALGMPRWDNLRVTTRLDDYIPEVLGFARLRFRFPSDVRFPCLPVRSLNNLIFPRSGETYATAAEIWLALRLRAEIEIIHGVVIPMDAGLKPFQKVIKEATARRGAAARAGDILRDKLYKELGNSLYGKTAQGLREKRVFDTRAGTPAPLPASEITNPFIAAAVTGMVRAVLAEMMNAVPAKRSIISVTTDGFITDTTEPEVAEIQSGPLCRSFSQARTELTGKATILEVKHRATQVLCWRTRGQATIAAARGEPPILAKAGFKPPRGMAKDEQNSLMLDLFCDREITSTYEFKNLRSLSTIYKAGGDLVTEVFLRRLRMDYDWKRRPARPSMAEINGRPHLSFATEPWNNVEEFTKCREQWQRFQHESGRCLKTVADLEAFQEFAAGDGLNQNGLYRSGKGGMATAAIRQFLRAFVRSQWGLDAAAMSYPDLVKFLRRGGFEVQLQDVKNAHRPNAKLVPAAVSPTGAVMKFVAYVETQFPHFDAQAMLVPSGTIGGGTYSKPKNE